MLVLRTFGTLTLENGGRPLTGAGTQRSRLALLAVLAAAEETGVSRESLLALFWPERDSERARGALKQALYALRRDLGEQEFTTGGSNLSLNPAVITSDVIEFKEAVRRGDFERAVVLHRGVFLDGVHISGGEFDHWLDRQRRYLQDLCQDALERLARDAESRRDYSNAVSWWRRLAAVDALSAGVATSLMRALANWGEGAAAVRHARVYEQLIRTELDLPPDRSVTDLAAQISHGNGGSSGNLPAAAKAISTPSGPQTPEEHSTPVPRSDSLTPTGRGANGPRTRAEWGRRWALVGAGALVAAAILATLLGERPARLDPDRVVLIARGAAGSDSELLAELASGLVERDRTFRVSLAEPSKAGIGGGFGNEVIDVARKARARYVVVAGSLVEGDSVRLVALVTDALNRSDLRSIDPVVSTIRTLGGGARSLRDRVAVALAAHRDPIFANWAHAAAMPNSWASYQELALGIQAFALGGADAREHFRAAASLDSTSGAPMVWEAFAIGSESESDSVLGRAEGGGRRMGPWEREMSKLLRAANRGDHPAAHAAADRLLEVVPGSEWALLAARFAFVLGRFREAAELTERVSENPGWSKEWRGALIIRDQSLHMLGDYEGELEVVRGALRRRPDSRLYLQIEAKALAGLGRVDEVKANCERALTLRPEPGGERWPCGQAIVELQSHGHPKVARFLAERTLAVKGRITVGTAQSRAMQRADVYEDLGEWGEVARALEGVTPSDVGTPKYFRLSSFVQAFHGDRPDLDRTRSEIDRRGLAAEVALEGFLSYRAKVMALLGDREAAIDLLVLDQGAGRVGLHWAGPFDRLRGHPRFDSLARPVEDAAHVAHVLRTWPGRDSRRREGGPI